ncbi:ParB/RepB/Spo0J family partition protein [Rhabdaerophilum sp. SD176]|uniref:ParB/RepB/Spo0J family partition protein n=1 Tax=Rhabdaerophilum sp. SD176 TaxID=2983548 RepID=UPI0024DFFB4A|nr:ParB/RepB/Spo0J family partition protein [Rhabdaerophilum sp. SD176]
MVGALAAPREIPLSQLVASAANVRKVRAAVSIDDLAEDIARRGLLQSLSVRPLKNEAGDETGQFAVQAGGRRLAALQKLQTEGRINPDHLIPCLVKSTGIEIEDSLAENVMRAGLHPLDQFRAFKALADDEGLSVDEIAARFFVSPQIVHQRLKLASASLTLLAAYAEDEMTLDQLMAFCVTADHARQEAVWEQIRHGYNKEPYVIRRLLTEGAVRGNDRRVLFVGAAAYEAAGGLILRDLFSDDGGGWFQDVALLDRLATEKLAEEAKAIATEGWKWVETALSFPYGHLNGLTRLSPTPVPVSADEQARYDAALAEYNALSEKFEGVEELPEEIDLRMGELEDILATVDERSEIFIPHEIAHAGVFVSIEHDGRLRIEAGYVRPEDRVPSTSGQPSGNPTTGDDSALSGQSGGAGPNASEDADDVEIETTARLSDRLVAELTAYRTLALRESLADDPDTALLTLTHALVLKSFYRFAGSETCLELDVRSSSLDAHAAELGESDVANRMSARQARWAGMLPKNPADLWDALVAFDADALAALFAWCVSTGVNALQLPHIRRTRELAHADRLADHVVLDMRRHWAATSKSFFGKVTKSQILATVREVKGEAAAQMIDHLKKSDMATEAERLVTGANWLPAPLRSTHEMGSHALVAPSATTVEAPTQPASEGSEDANSEAVTLPAFLTEGLASVATYPIAAE